MLKKHAALHLCTFKQIFTCLIVTAGRQSFSSSKRERHTVPDGYTFGWNKGGSNLPVCNKKKKEKELDY